MSELTYKYIKGVGHLGDEYFFTKKVVFYVYRYHKKTFKIYVHLNNDFSYRGFSIYNLNFDDGIVDESPAGIDSYNRWKGRGVEDYLKQYIQKNHFALSVKCA